MFASQAAYAPSRALFATRTASRRASRRHSATTKAASSIHEFTLQRLGGGTRDAPTDGAALPLSQFKGKVVLVNNIAAF
jgi:hypothetical protein